MKNKIGNSLELYQNILYILFQFYEITSKKNNQYGYLYT